MNTTNQTLPHAPREGRRRRPFRSLRSNWRWVLPSGLAAAALIGWLAFGYFGIHTLFIDDRVDEAAPVFDSGAGVSELAGDQISESLAEPITERAAEVDMPDESGVNESEPAMSDDALEATILVEGSFVDRSHPTSGRAVVLGDGSEQRFLRFEDFTTDNGPDLNVYLTTADAEAEADEFGRDGTFVDLGDLKGNVGPQNYEIAADVDLAEFDTVVIWCVRFGVAFGAADIAPPT
jgi:hypothetical protein